MKRLRHGVQRKSFVKRLFAKRRGLITAYPLITPIRSNSERTWALVGRSYVT